jgi:hypothetical protein
MKKDTDKKHRAMPKPILAVTVVYVTAVLVCLSLLNPEQCPVDYTQAQVDASDCIVGANIGLPLALFALTDIWAASMLFVWFRTKPSKK